jgi:exonuclease I
MNTENNKLLAEFLGNSTDEYGADVFVPNQLMFNRNAECMQGIFQFNECYFDTDWNWLMEIVEKIESLKHCQIDISLNWCRIGYKDTLFNYDSRNYFKGLTKIEAVYNACVEFVKWYNEQK